ncbi:hypothetical protein L6164_005862 [Bauhinia variegata]|uniref:Uncharacterized protein n=1 Tax=Bauhinia variegata TaxID=167791 RepID=A0ACB9PV98_BAUVA|nr:hypothetical protein L6164_005862 [Bauhinia variegata]
MATVSAFSSLHYNCFARRIPNPSSPSITFRNVRFQSSVLPTSMLNNLVVKEHSSKNRRLRTVKAAEEETQIPQQEEVVSNAQEEASTSEQQPVVVPISPSDTLTMFFQAEGTMSELAIPTVTKALQETEGVTSLNVQISEGIASVELKKQTTVQATGVASSLVETIQGLGFKLQTLNMSFDDEEYAAA